jgi:hypothetical protein
MHISETVIYVSSLCHRKGKLWKFFHAQLTRMHQLVTFGKLSNNVNTTGTGSMHVVASRVAIPTGVQCRFRTQNIWASTSYTEKQLVLGQQTDDYK